MTTTKNAKRAKQSAARKQNTSRKQNTKISSLPSRRAMEGSMAGLFGPRASSPVQQAQDLMYQAWESDSRQRRIELAYKALMISRNCADAHVLLAEEAADTPGELIAYYMLGVAAGERALGKRMFTEEAGHFWGILETRPYMRALEGLAACMRNTDAKEQAAEHYRVMLRLNPNDNQGIRYSLAAVLLELGDHDGLEDLLREYEEDISTDWHFSRALLSFRKEGDCDRSLDLLERAMESNPHVLKFLLGRKKLPKRLPEFYSFGEESEAINFMLNFADGWQLTPGALKWLSERAEAT